MPKESIDKNYSKNLEELIILWLEFENETRESRKMAVSPLQPDENRYFKASFADFMRWIRE
jgi:hypothetical protein